jgi:hypothetical protein
MDPVIDPGSPVQKPGYKTTEFYLTLVAMLLGALAASGLLDVTATQIDNQLVGMLIALLASLGYVAQRAWVKASGNKAAAFVEASKSGPSSPASPNG